jgi:hypothetical protein
MEYCIYLFLKELDIAVYNFIVLGENHRPAASQGQTWSHNVVSSTPGLSGIGIRNVSGDKHWLNR